MQDPPVPEVGTHDGDGTDGGVPTHVDDPVPCPRCSRRFVEPALRDLHLGRAHGPALAAHERTAYEAALEDEARSLRHLRRHVRAGLVTLPVALVSVVVLLISMASGSVPQLGLLLLPGLVAFGVLFYGMTYVLHRPDDPDDAG